MSTNERFDELARQKLEQRAFPFEESAWLAAQEAIHNDRSRRRGGWLPYAAGLIALLFATWLVWPGNEAPTVADTGRVSTTHPTQNPAIPTTPNATPAETSPAGTNASSPTIPSDHEKTSTQHSGSPAAISSHPDANVRPGNTSAIPQTAPAVLVPAPALAPPALHPHPTVPDNVEPTTTAASDPAPPVAPEPEPLVDGTEDGHEDIALKAAAAAITATAVADDPAMTPSGEEGLTPEPAASVQDPGDMEPGEHRDTLQSVSRTVPAPADSAAATVANDSASTPPQPLSAPPPIVDPRAPWEIGILAGPFQTSSIYSGGASETWEIAPQQTMGYGAELMHMGRNIGLGFGLHYGSYADRLRTPEETSISLSYERNWYLYPVDTTILIITDVDSNGVATGVNVQTTVQVLGFSDDTVSSVRTREAREMINRTSYIEVPLLFDAHLVQGRWSLGLRGGPTIGLLTQREGSVPSDDGETYTTLNEVAMRSWVFGWTARAYIRYRFNSAWSIGFEPAARGQLMDNLDDQGITRRSSALGGMISLSYRLR